MMHELRKDLPELPRRIKRLPVDRRGYRNEGAGVLRLPPIATQIASFWLTIWNVLR